MLVDEMGGMVTPGGSEPFSPVPYFEVSAPTQLKVFTDPLRIRVLNVLSRRDATNQQVSDSLDEPTAKVLYHVRFLLDAGLIRLVRTEVKGGNVEKYYRAIAHRFALTPFDDGATDLGMGATTALLDAARHEILSSVARWPDQDAMFERRPGAFDASRLGEFRERLAGLVDEFWTDSDHAILGSAVTSDRWRLLVAVYRDPTRQESEG
jgi:DNA-binding transcriptional ArsR family regulator